jgi:riboflavin synthase
MFTGIVKDIGTVRSIQHIPGGLRLTITVGRMWAGMNPGDSIALNGVCQTVVALGKGTFSVEVLPETLKRTTLGRSRPGERINLEPAVGPSDRFGGHLVSGHVDAVGTVRGRHRRTGDTVLLIGAPAVIMTQLLERGSVAVDGVSLTVVSLHEDAFTVALIPHTLRTTTLADRKVGDAINLETDLIVKAVQRLLDPHFFEHLSGKGKLTEERLRQLGF